MHKIVQSTRAADTTGVVKILSVLYLLFIGILFVFW